MNTNTLAINNLGMTTPSMIYLLNFNLGHWILHLLISIVEINASILLFITVKLKEIFAFLTIIKSILDT